MLEYIERDKAIAICQSHYEHCLKMHDYSGDSVAYDIRANIQGLPTADVVEVVRCKDCRRATEDIMLDGFYSCVKDGLIHDGNHFCSHGKRKEGADR